MLKRITLFVVTALMVSALAAPVAFAASPAQEACEDPSVGGTFTKTGPGEFTCVLPPEDTNPGNPQSDSFATPKHEQTSKTQTGQGGGGVEAQSELNCVYNNGGQLQERQSDVGCPPTQQ